MARIKMHIPKAKLPFYPPCEVKCRLQNGVSTLTNSQINLPDNTTLRTWKKIAREFTPQQENINSLNSIDRRPLMELDEPQLVKKKCKQTNEVIMQENYKADAGC